MIYNKNTLMSVSDISKSEINNIDEDMIPILIELNSKGYNTSYCCGGHTNEKGWRSYIAFKDDLNFNFPIEKQYSLGSAYFWEGQTEESRLEWLCKMLEWAKTLPKVKDEPQYYYEIKGGGTRQKGAYNKEKIVTNGLKNYVVTRTVVGFKKSVDNEQKV